MKLSVRRTRAMNATVLAILAIMAGLASLSFTPLQFISQNLKERAFRQPEKLDVEFGLSALHDVAFLQRQPLLAIHGQVSLFASDDHPDFNQRRVLHNQRTV